jgi:protein-disulfide isomerase
MTLLAYGDYECPYSAMAHVVVRRLDERLNGQLRVVFRHFPRADLHPHAALAARMAEAAALQGKFWAVHDALFHHQDRFASGELVHVVRGLVDVQKLVRDMSSTVVRARVDADVRRGRASGVEVTPTFFLNGERYAGSWDFETLLARLQLAGTRD